MPEPPVPNDRVVVVTDSDLSTDGITERILGDAGWTVRRASCRTADEVRTAAADATALIVQWAPVDASVIRELTRCRFICRLGIGYDSIDVVAASSAGIAVANVPDYCVEEVAAHTLAFILGATRAIVSLDESLRAGRWSVGVDGAAPRTPSETTVAVLGYGRIGSRVADLATALGYRVLVHDPYVPGARIGESHEQVALDGADIVTLHLPLTAETRHLIGEAALARMRSGAILVNTCRGGLVDEAALAGAVHDGRIGGAALDVFEQEPLPPDSRLRDTPNVVLTPHAAWYSRSAPRELESRAAQQVADFLAGRPVPTIVNPDYVRAAQLSAVDSSARA
jgi:D-3-phosphoglycerate dehydrogenase